MKKVILFLIFCSFALASFPKLTGQIVDEAGLINSDIAQKIQKILKTQEAKDKIQIIVVTVDSLDNMDIARYGVELGRHWQIGQKGKDNGILLIVAPNERKVNISVGYGLEGVLTDAISSTIIQEKILPEFKNNNYQAGILKGVQSISEVLNDEYDSIALIRKILDKNADILESTYPVKTGLNLASYYPHKLFGVLFAISFLLLMLLSSFEIKLINLIFGSIALYSFCVMIITVLIKDFITGKLNYILLPLMIVIVAVFVYKNKD